MNQKSQIFLINKIGFNSLFFLLSRFNSHFY